MRQVMWAAIALVMLCGLGRVWAQAPAEGQRLEADEALRRALKSTSLTVGGKPFHAVVEIASPAAGAEYSGRVEVWWVSPAKYRTVIRSPKFGQERVVNGDQVFEKNDGEYYPRWLENFVLAVLDPMPVLKNFEGRGGAVMVGERMQSCLRRDDRPGGITDQMTWGMVCFSGSEPKIGSVLTTNVNLEFKDWKGFAGKQVPRTIQTDVLDYKPVIGRVTTLEELKAPDEAMFAVAAVTGPEHRIATDYVSTLTEEAMLETAPVIEWPPVREGKTEGYMIVYARTDRTGQVRETAKHNSDQPGLEQFGMEQALRYKFKPLVVDGVARQMEMPLVLHFVTKMGDPIPVLSVEEMKKQMGNCRVGSLRPGSEKMTLKVSVNERGELTGFGTVGAAKGADWWPATTPLRGCHFQPYAVNGQPTYYHGLVELTAP